MRLLCPLLSPLCCLLPLPLPLPRRSPPLCLLPLPRSPSLSLLPLSLTRAIPSLSQVWPRPPRRGNGPQAVVPLRMLLPSRWGSRSLVPGSTGNRRWRRSTLLTSPAPMHLMCPLQDQPQPHPLESASLLPLLVRQWSQEDTGERHYLQLILQLIKPILIIILFHKLTIVVIFYQLNFKWLQRHNGSHVWSGSGSSNYCSLCDE